MTPGEKNRKALTTAIRKAWAKQAGDWARRHNASGTNADPLPTLPLDCGRLAADLAAEGVLVPSALTDDELLACDVDPESRESPGIVSNESVAARSDSRVCSDKLPGTPLRPPGTP